MWRNRVKLVADGKPSIVSDWNKQLVCCWSQDAMYGGFACLHPVAWRPTLPHNPPMIPNYACYHSRFHSAPCHPSDSTSTPWAAFNTLFGGCFHTIAVSHGLLCTQPGNTHSMSSLNKICNSNYFCCCNVKSKRCHFCVNFKKVADVLSAGETFVRVRPIWQLPMCHRLRSSRSLPTHACN